MKKRRFMLLAAACAALAGNPAYATVFTGPGGQGVPVGSSSLIPTLDFSDTFTGFDDGGSNPARIYQPAVQGVPAYVVENTYGNPTQNFNSFSVGPDRGEFSFAADGPGLPGLVDGSPVYPGTSGAGSDTGFTQTGGNLDFGVTYGLRTKYFVQADFVATSDRIDITSSPSPGSIFQANSLSIFIRGDGSGNASLYNGSLDTPIQSSIPEFNTGLTNDGRWHNYAVEFDQVGKTVEIFVDEQSKGLIDLTTFAGGLYQNFSNGAVGAGAGLGGGQNRTWSDNFQVGGEGPRIVPDPDLPDPGNLAGLPTGLVSYWDFDEASGPVDGFTLNSAYDRQSANDGKFLGSATRVPGFIGKGAVQFDNTVGSTVSVGNGGGTEFTVSTGVAIEALIQTNWDISGTDTHEEIFRKEDGDGRVLFSFQNDSLPTAFPPVPAGPALSLGLNLGGIYDELDMPLNIEISSLQGGVPDSGIIYLDDPGTALGPNDVILKDGSPHHVVATYDSTTGEKAIFIDGLKRWAYVIPGNPLITSGGDAAGFIGSSNGSENFDGVMDEVAYWSRSLTAAEIADHYANILSGKNYFGMTPPTEGTPGDTDGDGDVDLDDLNAVRNNFGGAGQPGSTPGDAFPFDGVVDLDDLNGVRNNFGTVGASAVPEPASWAMLSLAGFVAAAFARRRK